MDKKLLEQVADIHCRAFTVDAHFDLTFEVTNRRERGLHKVVETSYLQQFRAGGFDLIVSALFIHDYFLPEMGLRRALDQISHMLEEIEESRPVPALSYCNRSLWGPGSRRDSNFPFP